MVRKNNLPQFPDSYIGLKAEEYDSQKWMERNQKRTALRCIEFLYDEKLGKEDEIIQENIQYLILDLGCGTGYSSETLIHEGFRVIGIDILMDMLSKAKERKKINRYNNLELIQGDINHLPIKENSINHMISVSSYNFIIHGKENKKVIQQVVNSTAKRINDILKKEGRVIIEFYPNNEEELEIFKSSFLNNNFDGFLIKNNPNQKSGQTFLLLKKI